MKLSKILAHTDERSQELEGEKENFTECQQLDQARRSAAHTLYDKELIRPRKTEEDIECMRTEEIEET